LIAIYMRWKYLENKNIRTNIMNENIKNKLLKLVDNTKQITTPKKLDEKNQDYISKNKGKLSTLR